MSSYHIFALLRTALPAFLFVLIVEAYGGVIEVLSREEFGTRLTVELPQMQTVT